MVPPGLLRRKPREPFPYFVSKAEARVQRPQASSKNAEVQFHLPTPLMTATKQQRQALTLVSVVVILLRSHLSYHYIAAVLFTTMINRIATCFKAFPLLYVGQVMPLFVLDGEAESQFSLVFLKKLYIK